MIKTKLSWLFLRKIFRDNLIQPFWLISRALPQVRFIIMLQQYYWTLLLNGWFIKDLEKLVCLQCRGQLPSYLLEFLNHQPWKEFLMIYVKQEWTLFFFNSPQMAPLNSSSSHNKKMKTSRHISKSLTKKCSTWRIYLNSLSLKPKSMESITIFYRNSSQHETSNEKPLRVEETSMVKQEHPHF